MRVKDKGAEGLPDIPHILIQTSWGLAHEGLSRVGLNHERILVDHLLALASIETGTDQAAGEAAEVGFLGCLASDFPRKRVGIDPETAASSRQEIVLHTGW